MIAAIDTETTGLDLTHGCKPFCVIACTDEPYNGENEHCWEWPVNPLTRQPKPKAADLDAIRQLIDEADELVLHNAKFDVQALGTVAPDIERDWPWHKTHDTAVERHLLKSNGKKGLDSLSVEYLRTDITKYEKALHEAVEHARRIARKYFPKWLIASEGDPHLPSCKQEAWRNDYWLPREVFRTGKGRAGWDVVLKNYAQPDPVVTLMVHQRMQREIADRKLNKIYDERRRLLPVVYAMERKGVTVNPNEVKALKVEYTKTAGELGDVCRAVAKRHYGVDLKLPKAGRNDQLADLMLNRMALPPVYDKKSKTGKPTLGKPALNHYIDEVLTPDDHRYEFVKALRSKRSRDTACQYLDGYTRFWVPHELEPGWVVLHPSFNMVGTDTLRFSSRNPNGQNISKKEDFNLRKVFCPPPGWEFWSFDARGIEDRLPAYKSGQQELIDIFEKANEPPYYGSNHILRFETIYPDIWHGDLGKPCRAGKDDKGKWKCKCEGGVVTTKTIANHVKKLYADTWYQWCKNGGFAIQYGAVDKADGSGTADRAFHKAGAHALLKQRFSALEKLNRGYIEMANRLGYVETFPDASVDPERGYPLWCTVTDRGKILETVPLSYVIQGSAMWWTCRAMVRVEAMLEQWRRDGFECHVVLQVHDEILVAMPKKADPKKLPHRSNLGRARIISQEMARGGDEGFGIPTPTGIEYHPDSYSVGISF